MYIETSVISYLTSRPSRDLVVAAHQQVTAEWWEQRSNDFTPVTSPLVLEEAGKGDRLAILGNLPVLEMTAEAINLAHRIVAAGPLPSTASADATHLAIAAAHGVHYLLTWNCKHLANMVLRDALEEVVEDAGFAAPVICTPEQLMEEA